MLKRFKNFAKNFLGNHDQPLVLITASILSIGFFIIIYSQGLTLAFEDGRAHLNISRRVVDSLTPGLVQLGNIWLPLPHILMLPFVWNDFFWHSGLAGTIPSVFSFILAVFFLYNFLKQFFDSKVAGLIGALIFMTNPNLLFIQTAPMTESLSIALFMASVYFFWKWVVTDNDTYLIITGGTVFLTTLTRYDGWILPIIISLCLFFLGVSRRWNLTKIEGRVILFLVPATLGIILWLFYNFIIFNHPLSFAVGKGSASWFAKYEESRNVLLAKHSLLSSLQIFGWNIIDISGFITTGIAMLGLLFFLIKLKNDRSRCKRLALLLLILSPVIFNIFSIFQGQSVMWSRWVYPYKIYNVRYALQALPALAMLAAVIPTYRPIFTTPLIIILLIIQLYIFRNSGSIILLKDITQTRGSPREKVGNWLAKNPTRGLTLISAGANEVVIFDSGSPIKNFIYEGNKPYFTQALQNPYPKISRIVMGSVIGPQTDKVYSTLKKDPILKEKYYLSYSKDGYFVYDRKDLKRSTDNKIWKIRSVDTMKTSRDEARRQAKNFDFNRELEQIKNLEANYVAIDTPYDEEFYPYLKQWVENAHGIGLHVWFRGNWSGWEGWFGYPVITKEQHLQKTKDFILSHPGLFEDGDSFTACPECEYGGPGNPLETKDYEGFRKFMIEEYKIVNESFSKTGKKVYTNWFSFNPDVAKEVLDTKTVEEIGNLITLDYFVKDVKQMEEGLNFFTRKFPQAKILIGEFGAPISDINGVMTDKQQKEFTKDIFSLLARRPEIVGINYWVSSMGSTALLTNQLEPKRVTKIIQDYFLPGVIKGTVTNTLGSRLKNIKVQTSGGNDKTSTNRTGSYTIVVPAGTTDIIIGGINYKRKRQNATVMSGEEVTLNAILEPQNIDLLYQIRFVLRNLCKKLLNTLKK